MKKIIAITLREWKVFFYTPFALIILPIYLALCGTYFYSKLDRYVEMAYPKDTDMVVKGLNSMVHLLTPFFGDLLNVLVFITPLITMRSFAEEKKLATYDLMISYPVKPMQILLGKYFGSLGLVLGLIALSLFYPLLIIAKGHPYIPQIFSSYLGIILFILFFVAFGVVSSLFTENQIVAALVSYGMVLLAVVIQWLAFVSPAPWDWVFANFLFLSHQNSFRSGIVFLGDIVLYISSTLIVLSVGFWKIRQHYIR